MDRKTPRSPSLSVLSLIASCTVLGLAVAPVAVAFAAGAGGGLSATTLWCAAVAGGVCWFAAALALVTTYLANLCQAPVQGLLAGMFFRMGLPLAALVILPTMGGVFAAPGLTTTLLGVYLVALLVETILALRLVPQRGLPRQQTARVS